MASVKPKTFYPENGVTDSAEVNANYNAYEGSLGNSDINNENIRTEGVDYRNLDERPIHSYVGLVTNNYKLAIGASPATGAIYLSNTESGGQNEYPINHDSAGNTNTGIGVGTKLQLNGTAGVPLHTVSHIHLNWDINVFQNYMHAHRNELVSKLLDTTTKDGGTGATHPYGSGIGEWCWLVYPKFNTTSNALNNSDFDDAKTAGIIDSSIPALQPDGVIGNSIATNYRAFHSHIWDQVMVIPEAFFACGSNTNSPFLFKNVDKDTVGGDASISLGGPQMFNGSYTIKVKDNVSNSLNLYGVQLYISGYWRMHSNATIGGNPDCGMFLEYDECDPSKVNTDGDPIPEYGVDGRIAIERTQINALVYSKAGA